MVISSCQGLLFGGCYGLVFGSYYEYQPQIRLPLYLRQIAKYQALSCVRIVPILMSYRLANLYFSKKGYNENLSYVVIIGAYVLGEVLHSKIKRRR